VPPGRRPLVSRQTNLVIVGGVASGTWSATRDKLSVKWFAEGAAPPGEALADEISRLATILDLPLQLSVGTG